MVALELETLSVVLWVEPPHSSGLGLITSPTNFKQA